MTADKIGWEKRPLTEETLIEAARKIAEAPPDVAPDTVLCPWCGGLVAIPCEHFLAAFAPEAT